MTPSGSHLEIDFFYPQLKLAIEYQGIQHYSPTTFLHNISSHEQRFAFDQQKSHLCKEKGITLVTIPYWWDKQLPSLYATLYHHRPDLFTEPPTAEAIPLGEPSAHKIKTSETQKQMKKSIMTSTIWTEGDDPTGWWMTEKYDGVRLLWNGTNFYTRQGRVVQVPESIKKQMPSTAMDG